MTLPPVVRVFFAIDLPLPVKEKLGSFIGALKKKSRTNAIRWSKPVNLHITLQFLSEMRAEHIALLVENVRAKIEGAIHHSTLTLGKVHLFPSPYRPRVMFLDVTPQADLAQLSQLIGHGIKATDYEIEDKPYRAHLTIGRIKHAHGVDLKFLSTVDVPEIGDIDVNEVVLYRSEPLPEGSRYTPLERISLVKRAIAS